MTLRIFFPRLKARFNIQRKIFLGGLSLFLIFLGTSFSDSCGQTVAQTPQPMQRSSTTHFLFSSIVNELNWHRLTHLPQPVQDSSSIEIT